MMYGSNSCFTKGGLPSRSCCKPTFWAEGGQPSAAATGGGVPPPAAAARVGRSRGVDPPPTAIWGHLAANNEVNECCCRFSKCVVWGGLTPLAAARGFCCDEGGVTPPPPTAAASYIAH